MWKFQAQSMNTGYMENLPIQDGYMDNLPIQDLKDLMVYYSMQPHHQYQQDFDLQLAAELGKTLLERNKDLETKLSHANQAHLEQNREIHLLEKQLEALRNVSESRMRVYEEVDKNQQDLERTNEKLRDQAKENKNKIKNLTDTISDLEYKSDELQNKIDTLRDESRKLHSSRRTSSVPSLVEARDDTDRLWGNFTATSSYPRRSHEVHATSDDMWNILESRKDEEIKHLKGTVYNVKEQLNREHRKREDMEQEISAIMQENSDLDREVELLKADQIKIGTLECQLEEMELRAGTICKYCQNKIAEGCLPEVIAIEPDDLQELHNAKLHRLKSGGSAYGSRESLNNMGLETCDDEFFATPSRDITDMESLITPSRESAPDWREEEDIDAGRSILGEMEEQYIRLVQKYEALVETKTKHQARDVGVQKNNDPSRPTSIHLTCTSTDAGSQSGGHTPVVMRRKKRQQLDITSPRDPTEDHFDNGPPEYKQLFAEIFQTLRRSVVIDDDQSPMDPLNPKTC